MLSTRRPASKVLLLATILGAFGCASNDPATFSIPFGTSLAQMVTTEGRVDLGKDATGTVGPGWHAVEAAGRWTATRDARLTIPLAHTGPGRVEIRVSKVELDGPDKSVRLSLNGALLPPILVGASLEKFVVDVPDGVFRRGDNAVILSCDRLHRAGSREVGVFVASIRLIPEATGVEPTAPVPDTLELALDRWIEDRQGELLHGALDLEWSATAAPIEAATLRLMAVDSTGAATRELDRAEIGGTEGRVQLRAEDRNGAAHRTRVILESPHREVRVTVSAARRTWPQRDDILLIIVDTLRADALSCYDAPTGTTPHLDALAERGVLFTDAVAHVPITGPSHATMFLSQLPLAAGIVNNHEGRLTPEHPTLAELLRARGYRCNSVLSIDPIRSRFGFGRGFDIVDETLGYAFLRRGEDAVSAAESLLVAPDTDPKRPLFTLVHLAEPHEPYDAHGSVRAEATMRVDGRIVDEVSTSDFAPGLVTLDLEAGVHTLALDSSHGIRVRRLELRDPSGVGLQLQTEIPREIPDGQWSGRFELSNPGRIEIVHALNDRITGEQELRRRYDLETRATDRLVGRLLAALDRSGRADRTWVVFTSDHGEGLGEHSQVGHVQLLYEEAVHVPLIYAPPRDASMPIPSRREHLVAGIDLAPTILGCVGVDAPTNAVGIDALNVRDADRLVLLQTNRPQARRTLYAHRSSSHKFIWEPATDAIEFYDLRTDRSETQDLSVLRPEEASRWKTRLEAEVASLLAGHERGTALVDDETVAALRSLGYIE